ncbi:MAG: hypothetical protein HKN43_05115 [Rhodothermales bacterium]|nr:hypothetical protein [Rhodothermales bacterium]
MTFLNPLLLAGLFLAAIPFVIHLFNFRKPRKVDFSSLEFVRELKKTTMQKVRIKQWLLLLLRTLALICLVLVFARPSLKSRLAAIVGGDARTSVGIVLDNSPSMELRSAEGGYLEQARLVAERLADKLEPGDDLALLTLSNTSPSEYTTAVAARAGIQSVEIAETQRTIVDAANEMAGLLAASDKINKELYIIGDGQRSTLGDSLESVERAGMNGYVLQIGDEAPANVGLSEVRVTSRIIEVGQPVNLAANVVNYGEQDVEGYIVSAYLGNSRIAQATTDIPAGASADVELTVTPQQRGWQEGEVRLEDDAFLADNQRHFVLDVPDVRRILVVRGRDQETSYVTTAIRAGQLDGRALFQVSAIEESQIAASNIDDYHIVFMVGVADLTSGEINILSRYIDSGGGVVIFPSKNSSIADYNNLFAEIQGGRFEGFIGAEGLQQPVTRLESVETDHPLFDGVFDEAATGQVERPDIFLAADYRPVRGTEQTLMRLANGKPLLQEIRSGSGSAMLFAVLPDPAWSDLPVRGLFVPLLYRSIYYLSSSASSGYSELTAGRPGQIVLPGSVDEDRLQLRNSAGIEFTPEMRRVTGGLQIVVPATMNVAGITSVIEDTSTVGLIPVNPDPLESNLERVEREDLAGFLRATTGVQTVAVNASGLPDRDFDAMITEARSGVELWRPLLFACLILLIVEMLIARLWVPESAQGGI